MQQQQQLAAQAQAQAALNGWMPAAQPGWPMGAAAGAAPQPHPYGGRQGALPANNQSGHAWQGPGAQQPQLAAMPTLTPDEIDELLVRWRCALARRWQRAGDPRPGAEPPQGASLAVLGAASPGY